MELEGTLLRGKSVAASDAVYYFGDVFSFLLRD
jgi:hypothetical protein